MLRKHFLHYQPFVGRIHSHHKGPLMQSFYAFFIVTQNKMLNKQLAVIQNDMLMGHHCIRDMAIESHCWQVSSHLVKSLQLVLTLNLRGPSYPDLTRPSWYHLLIPYLQVIVTPWQRQECTRILVLTITMSNIQLYLPKTTYDIAFDNLQILLQIKFEKKSDKFSNNDLSYDRISIESDKIVVHHKWLAISWIKIHTYVTRLRVATKISQMIIADILIK